MLPLNDVLTGEEIYSCLRLYKLSEKWSSEELEEYQNKRLRLLISYATENIPFYRDTMKSLGLVASDIRTVEDLKRLPIINKEIIKKEGIERFLTSDFKKREILINRSSGSTGEPFTYYMSKKAYSMIMAAKLYSWYKAGYRLGDKYMKIANGQRHGWLKRIQDAINNCVYVPFYAMNEQDIARTLVIIEKKKPTIIRSYPMPIYQLAMYRASHPEYKFHPKMIMTTGSTLPDTYRVVIEKAFGCKIMDSYSCEGNSNYSECIGNHHYHVAQEYGITEVLDTNGNPVSEGIGRIVTTDLWNFAHPFIRYDTQDLAEINTEKCPSGDNHMMIKRILGRECESFINSDGRLFTIHSFEGYFKDATKPFKDTIDAYQVVKMKDGSIRFRLVVNELYTERMSEYLIDYWGKQFKLPVSIEIVSSIPIMNNNKRLTIVDQS